MNEAYLLIGGNLGDRKKWLAKALESIKATCGRILATSSVYESEAWGMEDQGAFLNQAIHISTSLSPEQLLETILIIENSLGRKREVRYGPRTIDIDILLYGNEVIGTSHLVIPHPEMQNRRFALICLNDIAPDTIHPKFHITISELLQRCNDPLKVYKIY